MAVITSKNRDSWLQVVEESKANNPLNKMVKVVKGRKHKGSIGLVTRLMEDKYYDWRYTSESSRMLKQINGREGYIALIKQDTGDTFWVKSTYLEILSL